MMHFPSDTQLAIANQWRTNIERDDLDTIKQ